MRPIDIVSVDLLAEMLGIPLEELKIISRKKKIVNFNDFYSEDGVQIERIPLDYDVVEKFLRKKNGGMRRVYVASSELSNILKSIQRTLSEFYDPPDCVHGFVSKRSVRTNAMQHLCKATLLKIDIENFFESINEASIASVFEGIGFNKEMSEMLTSIVCVRGFLPQGFCTSPILANLVAREIDRELSMFAVTKNYRYTRYVDDMVFSSDEKSAIPLTDIQSIIEKYGFRINRLKTKHMFRGEKQIVTGLTIFDDLAPRIPKHLKRKIRLEMYYIKRYGLMAHISRVRQVDINDVDVDMCIQEAHRIFGWLFYINSIEPNFSRSMFEKIKGNEIETFKDFIQSCRMNFLES